MSAFTEALARLGEGYYNSGQKSDANPGGFSGYGNVINYPASLLDIFTVASEIAAATGHILTVADAAGAAHAAKDDVIALVAFAEAAAAQFIKATLAQVRTGADDVHFVTAYSLAKAAEPIVLAYASTVNWNMAAGWNAKVTLTGSPTIGAPTNPLLGMTYILDLIEGGAGGYQPAWHACWDHGENLTPILNGTVGKGGKVFAYCDSVAPLHFACNTWLPA